MNPVTFTLTGGPLEGHEFGPVVMPESVFSDDTHPFTSFRPPAGFSGMARGLYRVRRGEDGAITAVHVKSDADAEFAAVPDAPIVAVALAPEEAPKAAEEKPPVPRIEIHPDTDAAFRALIFPEAKPATPKEMSPPS